MGSIPIFSTMTFQTEDYETIKQEEGPQAERLAAFLIDTYHPKSVIDIGCATGLYLKHFIPPITDKVTGVELESIDSSQLDIHPDDFYTVDITKINLSYHFQKHDLAICLEVMEHIEEEEARIGLENLCRTSDRIIFSAAIPGQGGNGHINCQPKEYWLKAFAGLGFYYSPDETDKLINYMRNGYHMGWFTQNAMVMKN